MRQPAAFLIAISIAGGAHAAPSEKFNLACTKISGLGAVPAEVRVDLESLQYCVDACTTVEAIEEVTASRVLLNTTYGRGTRWSATHTLELDRLAGTYRDILDMRGTGGGKMVTEGKCEVRPFSGFPEGKF